jgi:hypothetical protein
MTCMCITILSWSVWIERETQDGDTWVQSAVERGSRWGDGAIKPLLSFSLSLCGLNTS